MTIQEAIDDINIGVTDRKSLRLAVRGLQGYDMIEKTIQAWLDDAMNETESIHSLVLLDVKKLIKHTREYIEGKPEDK